jgi:DNA repair/transcription protein MET18/MMS19
VRAPSSLEALARQVELPESLAERVALFCAEASTAAESAAVRDSVTAAVAIGTETVLKVVEASQASLTSTDNGVRNRGTMLLADVIEALPEPDQGGGRLNEVELATLLGFFSDRLSDEPCAREALRGAASLSARCPPAPELSPRLADALVGAADALFSAVHVQALSLSDRRNAYRVLQAGLERGAPLAPAGPEGAVLGLTHAMDGERDPRNLVLCFGLVRALVAAGLVRAAAEAAQLFAVFSCYFPITFTPPPGDTVGITPEQLTAGLLECLAASPLWARDAMDLALGKLAAGELVKGRSCPLAPCRPLPSNASFSFSPPALLSRLTQPFRE